MASAFVSESSSDRGSGGGTNPIKRGRAGLPNTMHGAAGDFSRDPLMRHVAGAAGQTETFTYNPNQTNFTEGDLRRGSLRGPSGQVMQPGFERGRMR